MTDPADYLDELLADPTVVVLKDIEIVSTGTWRASTGVHTITPEDLVAAVAASQDPGFVEPRGKPGHSDDCDACAQCHCGSKPALGVFTNLRLTDDGHSIIADHVIRSDIAATLASDYPSRSFEGYFDVTSPQTGKQYSLIVSAVALLGVDTPAITVLPDLSFEDVCNAIAASGGRPFRTTNPGGSMPVRIAAQLNEEDIRRAFYAQLGDRLELWPRAQLRDPDEYIVESWNGEEFYRVPYTISGDEVTFGEPVRQEFTDASAPSGVAAVGKRIAARFASRAESRPATPDTEDQMTNVAIAQKLGVPNPETATEADILAHIDAQSAAGGGDGEAGDGDEATEETVDAGELVTATGLPAGVVPVSEGRLRQLEEDAAQGVAARAQQVNAHRSNVIAAAKGEGKITPAEVEHFATLHEANPVATEALLAAMPAGKYPVTGEIGSGANSIAAVGAVPDDQRARLAAFRGKSTTTTKEG